MGRFSPNCRVSHHSQALLVCFTFQTVETFSKEPLRPTTHHLLLCMSRKCARPARGRGCRVTDDTSAVIPLTSASNLRHEKDTPVTSYLNPNSPLLPPTISCPAPPTFCSAFNSLLFLSFQPKSNSVSGFLPQLAIKDTKAGTIYSSLPL